MSEQNDSPAREQALQREWKPASELSNKEIVSEARSLHAHFEQLQERYREAPANQRSEIREEMAPVVNRERELRQEAQGRLNPELSQDRVPDGMGIKY